MSRLEQQALQYCLDVVNGVELAPPEVIAQCQWTLDEIKEQHNDDFPYFIDHDMIQFVEDILSLLNFATGIDNVIGERVIDKLHGYQAYFFYSVFGWKYKNNPKKYRWRDICLFIPRKNAKTFLIAICIIIYLLSEDDFSEIYSISLDRDLASEVKKAMAQLLDASNDVGKFFVVPKTLNGKLTCKITNSYYQPRTADSSKNNSIRPSV